MPAIKEFREMKMQPSLGGAETQGAPQSIIAEGRW